MKGKKFVMQASKTITTVLPPPDVALIVSTSNQEPPAVLERSATAPRLDGDGSAMRVVQDDSANYRADMLRRYESPFDMGDMGWHHGGLNE